MSDHEPAIYRVEISPHAERDLKRLHRQDRHAYQRVIVAIRQLTRDPRPQGVKSLRAQSGWRIRIGEYRAINLISDEDHTVAILGVAHRRDVYRRI